MDDQFVTRAFWGLSTGSISSDMGVGRLAEFRAALDHAEQVMVRLRQLEVASIPEDVIAAFDAEGVGPESVFEEKV
jgi:hypothetical protein